MLIHDKFYCQSDYNYDRVRHIASKLSKRQNVEFALYCAKDVFHLVDKENKGKTKCCLDLAERWLVDGNPVTSEELRNANNFNHYYFVVDAAWDAARAAGAAAAGWSADWATWSAADWSVASISYSVCAWTNPNNKLNEYLIIANSYLTKTNINCSNYEIEGKILYLIDELEENIIVHKDKYYVNMNGIENCPEYGFDSQEELLEELLYSEDHFWGFVRNWLDQLYKEGSNVDS